MKILNRFKLDGKVALVTGGNRGIGFAIATGLAQAGADIINVSRGAAVPELRAAVVQEGRRFAHIQADLSEIDSAESTNLINQAVTAMGRLDILVNNAGIAMRGDALDFDESKWQQTMQVNLNAPFYLAQAAARQMREQGGGKIIQIASVLSFQGGIGIPAYTATKHAIAGLTKALANEWAAHNINVNAIAPGYFRTDMTAALEANTERNEALLTRIPAERWGDPAELQGAALLLASEAGSYMHGSIVSVDGGWLAR